MQNDPVYFGPPCSLFVCIYGSYEFTLIFTLYIQLLSLDFRTQATRQEYKICNKTVFWKLERPRTMTLKLPYTQTLLHTQTLAAYWKTFEYR